MEIFNNGYKFVLLIWRLMIIMDGLGNGLGMLSYKKEKIFHVEDKKYIST